MLAVQQVSVSNYSPKLSFQKNGKQAFEEDKVFYEQQKREIEGLLSDERLPKKMKKFLNAANIITDGLIAGFTVACATIASATCGKNTLSRVKSNKLIQESVAGFKPFEKYAEKGLKVIKRQSANIVRKLFGEEKGQKIVNIAKKVINSFEKFIDKLNPFKSEEAFDKATTKTATGLGIGAGAASAYAKTVEKSEHESGEE